MSNIKLIWFLLLFPFSPIVSQKYKGDIVKFEYGSDIITQESKVTLDSIVSWLNKKPKEHSIYLVQSWTCKKEVEQYPNIGIIRAKKVTDYMYLKLLRKDLPIYIDPRNYLVKQDCSDSNLEVPIGISIEIRPD
ncbi:MAG: hypothetical protein J7604_19620 [Sporocytophaga sp.]|uniref:hypothetical protein n=1 Tax=Sporocytophaga sp. TaxID=2231183 RepID=UPI001B2B2574|nr:hypothetical protein [Sporocytophaga sp.]MBO9702429.1 hypothetical protein [Sporocytophaga sp.]